MEEKSSLKEFLHSIQSLEREIKVTLKKKQPEEQLFINAKKQIIELLSFFVNFEDNQELQHKISIYSYIAKFIQEKVDRDANDFHTCLSATLFLCNEIDRNIYIEDIPSEQTLKLISDIKGQLIAIKVHYYRVENDDFCTQKTEIFSILSGKDKPMVTRIEESNLEINELPEEIGNFLINEKQESVSFQIYP